MSKQPPVWQLHDAKARFSELFRRVRTQGPQRVVKQRGEAVVIVAAEDFDRATARAQQPASLAAFFQSAPTGGRPLDLARTRDGTRMIKW
jgi:prevent-host-death family protein